VSQDGDLLDRLMLTQRWGILLSLLLLALAAGVIGYLFARALARPFLQLATAASALGRGRFDLDLPHTRVPEARQIGDALRTSAKALEVRIEREQMFAQHASHLLRTPLTSMRLELDDLALDDSLEPEVRRTIQRCVQRIEELDAVAGELVGLARGSTNMPGVDVPLHELATGCAQRWADELAHHDRTLTAAVEGDLDTTYTPGPVEHIHELLLVDVLQRSRGPVRLVYESIDSGALRLRISASEEAHHRNRRKDPASALVRARAVVTALGGRLEGEYHDRGLDIMLPRR
jgi:signal transduction histidine kinase